MTFLRVLYANRWVRYALTAALVALVIAKAQPQQLLNAVGSARPQYLAFALALTAPFLFLKVLRWHLMLREAEVDATFSEAGLSLIGGMGLALVTPARLGELIRTAYLRDPQKLKIGGLVLIDKGFDVLMLAALSVAGAWFLVSPILALVLATCALAGLAIVYRPQVAQAALDRAATRLPLGAQIGRAAGSLESLSARASTWYLVLTLAAFCIVLVQFGLILLSWHGWSTEIIFMTFPLVILTNVLPITVGGLGVREGASVLLLQHYGVSSAHATLAAFLMFSFNTALPGLAGALLLPALSKPDGP